MNSTTGRQDYLNGIRTAVTVHPKRPSETGRPAGPLSKQGLSEDRLKLVELMQDINFGRIERLRVRGGSPVVAPARLSSAITSSGARTVPGRNGPRQTFYSKRKVAELFVECLDRLQDGVVDVLEIKHGLPFRMTTTEVAA